MKWVPEVKNVLTNLSQPNLARPNLTSQNHPSLSYPSPLIPYWWWCLLSVHLWLLQWVKSVYEFNSCCFNLLLNKCFWSKLRISWGISFHICGPLQEKLRNLKGLKTSFPRPLSDSVAKVSAGSARRPSSTTNGIGFFSPFPEISTSWTHGGERMTLQWILRTFPSFFALSSSSPRAFSAALWRQSRIGGRWMRILIFPIARPRSFLTVSLICCSQVTDRRF